MQEKFVLYLMDRCEDSLSWAVFFFHCFCDAEQALRAQAARKGGETSCKTQKVV